METQPDTCLMLRQVRTHALTCAAHTRVSTQVCVCVCARTSVCVPHSCLMHSFQMDEMCLCPCYECMPARKYCTTYFIDYSNQCNKVKNWREKREMNCGLIRFRFIRVTFPLLNKYRRASETRVIRERGEQRKGQRGGGVER